MLKYPMAFGPPTPGPKQRENPPPQHKKVSKIDEQKKQKITGEIKRVYFAAAAKPDKNADKYKELSSSLSNQFK